MLDVALPEIATPRVAPGASARARTTVTNATAGLVAARDLVLTARRPGATHAGGPYDDIARTGTVLLDPADSIVIEGELPIPADGPPGTWRVYLAAQDLSGRWHDLTEEAFFEVAVDADGGAAGDAGTPVADAGALDALDAGAPAPDGGTSAAAGGCGCRGSPPGSSTVGAIVVALLVASRRKRR